MQNNFNNENPNNPLKEALLSCKVMIKFVLLFGCLINLLMLSTPLFSMQVLDRVLSSQNTNTLFNVNPCDNIGVIIIRFNSSCKGFCNE